MNTEIAVKKNLIPLLEQKIRTPPALPPSVVANVVSET